MSPTTTCLVSIVLAGAASGATLTSRPAYPIPPRPLRMLVEEADFIVTADVKAAGPEVPRENRLFPETKEKVASATIPNGPPPDAVVLHVDQVLKGDPGTRTIAQTNYRMICPEPAKYVVGTRVLAFLDRAEGGRFTTHALSYGAKTLGDAESEKVYVERVKEQQRILEMPEGAERLAAQVAWLVACAEHPATRWEGAYELCPDGDFMSGYDRDERRTNPFREALTKEQRDRLRDALLSAKTFDSGEQCLEALFDADRDPRLLAWLVAQLRATAEQVVKDSYCTASMLIERIARRDPRPDVKALAEAYAKKQTFSFEKGKDDGAGRLRIVKELLALY